MYLEVDQRRSAYKMLLKISQNSQDKTCTRVSFFNKEASDLQPF